MTENNIPDFFSEVKNYYNEVFNDDISEDFKSSIEPYISSKESERISIWKYFTEKLLLILEKQNPSLYPLFLSSIKELFSIIDSLRSSNNSFQEEIIEKLKLENQDLTFQNNELLITVDQLQSENRSYLEKIINSSKLSAEISVSQLKSPSERKEIIPRQPSKKQFMKSRISSSRELTLKQLKESIEEIYASKVKFDEKCLENRQPRETMDQFLYTYLNQKYGLKTLIGEWSVLILRAIEKFESHDSEVLLFSKILKHRIDEDFRQIFEKLKDNMKQLLKAKIQQRNPYIREVQLNAVIKEKLNGILDEDEWGTIIVSMFSQEEAEYMIGHIKNLIEEKSGKLIIGRRNRLLTGKSDATYTEVQNAILNYDLSAREALLEPFWKEFVQQDVDVNGILSEEEFRRLCERIGVENDTERLLDQVDPNTTGYINFSDCVTLFTYEMTQNEDGSQISVLHALFFQSQSGENQ